MQILPDVCMDSQLEASSPVPVTLPPMMNSTSPNVVTITPNQIEFAKLLDISKLDSDLMICLQLGGREFINHQIESNVLRISFRTTDERYKRFSNSFDLQNVLFKVDFKFIYEIDRENTSHDFNSDSYAMFYVHFKCDSSNSWESTKIMRQETDDLSFDEMPLLEDVNLVSGDTPPTFDLSRFFAIVPTVEPSVRRTGLFNSGNTCYQNSILQAFCRILPWRTFISIHADRIAKSQESLQLLRKIAPFTDKLNINSNVATVADTIKASMRNHTKVFENNNQHDAPEYFNALISALNIELKKYLISEKLVTSNENTSDESPINESNEDRKTILRKRSQIEWDTFFKSQPTPLTELFCGQTAQRLVCQECSHESNNIEPFEVLILNLPQVFTTYHVRLFTRNPVTCCCTDSVAYVFTYPPDTNIEDMLGQLALNSNCPVEKMRLLQSTVDGEGIPIGLKSRNCLISDTVSDPKKEILVFESETSEDIEEFVIIQKTVLRHMGGRFDHVVPITDITLKAGKRALGLPFLISVKKSLLNYKDFTRILMSYALRSVNVTLTLPPGQEDDLLKLYESHGRDLSLIYYKSMKNLEPTEYLAPFLLNEHGSNNEIKPKSAANVYLDGANLKTYGYCIELQWINSTHEQFPKSGMVRNIGEIDDRRTTVFFKKNNTLEDCLRLFSKEEDLGHDAGWKCEKCPHGRVAKKSSHLIRAPHILVIQLVRFKYCHNDTTIKDEDHVEIPVDGFDLKKWLYLQPDGDTDDIFDLYAVVNHHGKYGGGHYTAAVRNWDDPDTESEWYLYDDSTVTALPPDEVITSYAYLLFFKRRQFPRSAFGFSDILDTQNIDCDDA